MVMPLLPVRILQKVFLLLTVIRDFSMFIRPPYLYLSGDFGVDGEKRMVEPVHQIANVGWEQIGYPWFSGDGVFKTAFSVEDGFEKVVLKVPTKDIASVWVNGQFVGKRLWLAEEVDITSAVKPGENALEIRVTSTRANMYGCETGFRFGTGAIYAAYAGERTENGILAPARNIDKFESPVESAAERSRLQIKMEKAELDKRG